ncbi:hypothetical protein [Mesorhizobium tianshanense]|uniref:hypothetical protein n=1 Tax=Mesorhizobium tianshanense TaxID=39844 RepID=UPI0012DE4D4E|nr:hypothetical protein [Mesorhizobium tianshanense]
MTEAISIIAANAACTPRMNELRISLPLDHQVLRHFTEINKAPNTAGSRSAKKARIVLRRTRSARSGMMSTPIPGRSTTAIMPSLTIGSGRPPRALSDALGFPLTKEVEEEYQAWRKQQA